MPRVVRIPGLAQPLTFPTGTPDEEIYASLLDKLIPPEELPPAPPQEPGFTGAFGEGFTTLGGAPAAMRYVFAPGEESRKAVVEAGQSPYEYQQLSEIEGVGDFGRFMKEQAGRALGFITPPLAAAKAASVATPGPPQAKALAGAGTFLATAGAQYFSETATRQAFEAERQAKEGKAAELPDATKIIAAATGQAGVDLIPFTTVFKPLGRLFGLAGKDAAEQTAKQIAKKAEEGDAVGAAEILLGKKSVALGAAQGALVEAAQEPIQQILERWGAGLDLASDEAIKEYFESAVAGGLLGLPLGTANTVLTNVRSGAYDRDALSAAADRLRSTTDQQTAWKDIQKTFTAQAQPISVLDDTGNVRIITPELLAELGVSPDAKAIEGTPVVDLLNQPINDPGVVSKFQKFFQNRLKQVSKEAGRDDLTAEEIQNLAQQQERISVGLRTFQQIARDASTGKQKATKEAQKTAQRPEVFLDEINGVYSVTDPVKGTVRTFKTEAEANKFADKFGPKVEAQAPAQTEPTPEDIAAQTAADARANLYKDLGLRYPNDPEAVAAIKSRAEDLEVTMSPVDAVAQAEIEYNQQRQAEAAPETALEAEVEPAAEPTLESIESEINDVLKKQKELRDKIDTYLSADTRGRLVTPKRGSKRWNEWQALKEEYDNQVDYLGGTLLPRRDRARRAAAEPATKAQDQAAVGATTIPSETVPNPAPEPNLAAPAAEITEATQTPTPAPADPEVAAQLAELSDDFGLSGLASTIAARPPAEQAALTKQAFDTLAEIDRLEGNRKKLKAQGDAKSAKAVGEQIRKLENSLDDLEYSLTGTPNTRAQVEQVLKDNGNAAESKKIAAESRKEIGCP